MTIERKRSRLKALELFAGGGGMALGVQAAGFEHVALIESDANAVNTLKLNAESGFGVRSDMPLEEMDARQVRYGDFDSELDLLAAGAPCQPFSLGGNHNGKQDTRDLFPEVLRAQQEVKPKCVLVENVRGLARPSFRPYLEYILLRLALPGLRQRFREKWTTHRGRLFRALQGGVSGDLPGYNVYMASVECANLGIPQRRNRVFIVAFRADLRVNWCWPKASHSQGNLLFAKDVDESYWAAHNVGMLARERCQSSPVRQVAWESGKHRWRTIRDALAELPEPQASGNGKIHPNHVAIPGARTYPGHLGSLLDEPAKTIKAGVHGVPGGENMLQLEGGGVRYFTVHEAALLQTFPRDYVIVGTRSAAMRQIGNAAPPAVVEIIARKIRDCLASRSRRADESVPCVDLVNGVEASRI